MNLVKTITAMMNQRLQERKYWTEKRDVLGVIAYLTYNVLCFLSLICHWCTGSFIMSVVSLSPIWCTGAPLLRACSVVPTWTELRSSRHRPGEKTQYVLCTT